MAGRAVIGEVGEPILERLVGRRLRIHAVARRCGNGERTQPGRDSGLDGAWRCPRIESMAPDEQEEACHESQDDGRGHGDGSLAR